MSTVLAFFAPVVIVLAGVYLLWHNERVYRARGVMLRRVHTAATRDINSGNYDWAWRYDELEQPSYMEQFRALRKPSWPRDPARAER